MYKVRNKSLDKVFKKYDVSTLLDLDMETLLEVCEEMKVPPKRKIDDKGNVVGTDKYATAQILEAENTISEYMGELYWEQRHHDVANETDLKKMMSEDVNGDQTLERYANLRLGVYKLRPGAEAIVDWTPRWIREVLQKRAKYKVLEITAIGEEQEVPAVEESTTEGDRGEVTSGMVESSEEPLKSDPLESANINTLRSVAKDLGINSKGLDKEDLLKAIREQRS